MQPESDFEVRKLVPAQHSLWQENFIFPLVCSPSCLPMCRILERSIEGSTKLGQVKIGQGYFLRYSLPDSLYCLFSGCLTYLQCIMGIKDHQGQQPRCLLSSLCKLASRHQATSNSHSRQKISLKNKFHISCFCGIS